MPLLGRGDGKWSGPTKCPNFRCPPRTPGMWCGDPSPSGPWPSMSTSELSFLPIPGHLGAVGGLAEGEGSWGLRRQGQTIYFTGKGDHSGLIEPLRVAGVQQQQHRLDVLVPLPKRKNCIRKDAGLKGLALFNQKRNGEWGAWGHGACRHGGMGARHKQ